MANDWDGGAVTCRGEDKGCNGSMGRSSTRTQAAKCCGGGKGGSGDWDAGALWGSERAVINSGNGGRYIREGQGGGLRNQATLEIPLANLKFYFFIRLHWGLVNYIRKMLIHLRYHG